MSGASGVPAVASPLVEAVGKALVLFERLLKRQRDERGVPRPVVNGELVRMWATVLELSGVSASEVEAGAARVVLTATFFPTVAELLLAIRPPEDRELVEELAWQRVLSAVASFPPHASLSAEDLGGDRAALWSVSRLGFRRLGERLADGWRSAAREEFVRVYRAGRSQGCGLEYLVGSLEAEYRRQGLRLTPRRVGRSDWASLPACAPPVALVGAEGSPAALSGIDAAPAFRGEEGAGV